MAELISFLKGLSATTALAVYGALLSTLVLAWTLYRDFTDRGKLELQFGIGRAMTQDGPKTYRDFLLYTVTNAGRRPIVVMEIGATIKNKGMVRTNVSLDTSGVPRMLKPGEFIKGEYDDLWVITEGLVSLWALDSLGRYYREKRSSVRRLVSVKRGEKGVLSLVGTRNLPGKKEEPGTD